MTSGSSESETGARRAIIDAPWVAYAAFALAVVALWALGRASAGLDDPWLLIAIAAAVPLYVVTRAWRLPSWLHLAALALPLSVLVIALVHGYPEGAARAARYGYAALFVLSVTSWASTAQRRVAVAVAGIVLAADQYVAAWYWWWGKGDPGDLMRGMFHFHNQFGAYLAIGGALAAVIAVTGRRTVRLMALLGVGFACAGVVASGSRASLYAFAAAMVVALAISLAVHHWRGALRWGVAVAVGVAVTALMSSPLFFSVGEWGSVSPPARGQSVADSGSARLEHWWAGVVMGADRPLAGVGLNNYGPMNLEYGIGPYTSHPHSELVVAWAEGGILGLLPVLALYIGAGWLLVSSVMRPLPGVVRRVRWLPDRSELVSDAGRWAALTALAVALAHSLVDFDWVWPSLVAIGGMVAGAAAAPRIPMLPTSGGRSRARACVNVAALVGIVTFATTGYLIDPYRTLPLTPVGMWTGLL